jgi:hypothetical protein
MNGSYLFKIKQPFFDIFIYRSPKGIVKFIPSIIHSKFQEMPRFENSNSRKVSEKYHN